MKLKRKQQGLRAILAWGICGSLLMATPSFAAGKPVKKISLLKTGPDEEEPVKKLKSKSKAFASRNNSSVKIYPDAIKRNMHVVAKGNDGKEIDFFVFDVQGTLVQNYKMKSKDHFKMTGLAKGLYIYRVFSGDDETASGKFEIR